MLNSFATKAAMMMTHDNYYADACRCIYVHTCICKLYDTDIHVIRQSLFNYLQVIKSKGGKESEAEYFAALVIVF